MDLFEHPKKDEYLKLCEQIKTHNHNYHELDSPTISDQEYDTLVKQVIELETQYPSLKDNNSPTLQVGNKVSSDRKIIKHKTQMKSLANSYNEEELGKFLSKSIIANQGNPVQMVAELKFDGLALSLQYKDNVLFTAATRGDGIEGEDVTVNAFRVDNIPHKLHIEHIYGKLLEVRGEVVMLKTNFNKVNEKRIEQGLDPYATPRHAAAGVLRQLDPDVVTNVGLYFVPYDVIFDKSGSFGTHRALMNYVFSLGFGSTYINMKLRDNVSEMIDYARSIESVRDELPFDIDGVVFKVNVLDQRLNLGELSSRTPTPRWAIAFKFHAQSSTSEVLEIFEQVGRTGAITPVATIKPVMVKGIMVTKVNLHNPSEIRRKDVRIGDKVVVSLAADVIPEITQVLVDKRTTMLTKYTSPKHCPMCKTDLIYENDDRSVTCPNEKCGGRLIQNVINFMDRDGMNVKGLGDKTIKSLIDSNKLLTFDSLYHLTKQDFLDIPGFADKSAEKAINAIKDSLNTTRPKLIKSLGIPLVGVGTADVIAKEYPQVEDLMYEKPEILIVKFGEETGKSIKDYFNSEQNKQVLRNILSNVVFTDDLFPKTFITSNPNVSGKTFCVTGSLLNWESKEKLKEIIESQGGFFLKDVNKNLDYLISAVKPGSKLDKARKLGITIIGEDALQSMLN